MANQNRYVVAFGTFLVSPIDRSELFIVAFGGSFLDVVAFGGTHQGVMAHLGRTILEKSFSFILGLKISQQRLAFIEQYDDSTHQTGEVRNECVIVAKRHQKFPSARGYGPFMVPSRCPCLAWRSLFGAVPFWPLLVPFALLAPFGPFWPLLAPFALMAPFRLLWASWPLVCILRTPRHNNYCPIRVLGANGPGLVY
jgi:hypothetical protein